MKRYSLAMGLVLTFSWFFQVNLANANVVFGGFVDTYWGASTANPSNIDRQYTTQAARNNEFNINLAFLEAKVEADRMRGRLALQVGTSVQSNYSGEPIVGTLSGASLSRHIQEAYAGYRVTDNTWVDAGIMLSHIGLESFISRDNPTYTRSLVADFSPYYQAGAKVTHQFNNRVSAQLLVLNGWQNVSESNSNKAMGSQISWQATDSFSVIYNTFFGKELAAFKQFHDLILKYSVTDNWSLGAQFDIGVQDSSATGGSASWNGFAVISRHSLTKSDAIIFRAERYADPKNVLVATPSNDPFRAWGGSIGYDRTLIQQMVWRNELRAIIADRDVYVSRSGLQSTETLFVSSLGLTF